MIAALDEFPGAVIIVTHSEMFLHHLAERLIVFNEDKVFVFEGSYQDFLDRVGWEKEIKKPKKEKKAKKERSEQEEKEAAYHKKRSELQTLIATIEKTIDDQETALEAVNLQIAQASGKLSGVEIQQLQIKAHKHQQALDLGYKELEPLVMMLDLLEKEKV